MKEKSILKHFATVGLGTVINMILGFCATILITRIVNPAEYGELSLFKLYGTLMGSILVLGLDQALIRYYFNREELNYKISILNFCFGISFGVTVLALVGGLLLSATNVLPDDIHIVSLSFFVLGIVVSRFGTCILRLESKSKQFAWCNVLQQFVYLLCSLVLLAMIDGNNARILILATVIGQWSVAVSSVIWGKPIWIGRKNNLSTYHISSGELLRYAAPFIITMSVATLFQSVDKFAIKYYCDYSELGIYSSALVLVNIFAILQSTFSTMWTPIAVEHYSNNPGDKTFYQNAHNIIAVLMLFFGMTVILFKDIFVFILGEQYREAAFLIPFLTFHPMMYTISEVTVGGLLFAKKSNVQMLVSILPCVLNIIGNIILIPIFSGKGAAISTGVSYIFFYALRTVFSNRYYYVDYSLKKFSVLIILAVMFAGYSTFNSFNLKIAVMYVVILCVIFVFYMDAIKQIVNTLMRKIKRILRKER